MNPKKAWAVAVKEVRQIARDPFSLFMLLGLPAFIFALYGFALNFDVRHVALGVQDRDQSAQSRELLSTFVNSTYFDLVRNLPAGSDLDGTTLRREVKAILVIPEGYGRLLLAGRVGRVQLVLDGSDSQTATTILGYADALVQDLNLAGLRRTLLQTGRSGLPPIDFRPRVYFNPELRSTQFLVPGLAGFLLMLTAVLSTAMSIVREKERGTMEQLRVAPLRTLELILGKTVPYLGLSLLATVIILVAARVLFGVAVRGSYVDLFLATLLYLVGALAWGLLISTLVDSQALAFQAGLLTSLLPSVLLSGFIFQIRAMPEWLQVITHVVPARYYLVVMRGIILKGAGLAPYWDQLAWLAGFAVVTITASSLRLARKEG